MKVFFISEEFPNCGTEFIFAFANRTEAEAYCEKQNHPKRKGSDDPKYEIIEMEIEKDFHERVYLVFSIVEGYDYDGQIIFSDETSCGAFADLKTARCFLFNIFEQKPNQNAFLGLKEFPIIRNGEVDFIQATRVIFKCDYRV